MVSSMNGTNHSSSSIGPFGGRELVQLEKAVVERNGCFEADYHHYRLTSRFQSVYSFALQRQVGFEGYFRTIDTKNDISFSASSLFAQMESLTSEEATQVDRMRLLLHVKNFMRAKIDDRWLFFNLHPRVMLGRKGPDVEFIGELLEHTGLPPHQLVIALREHSLVDEGPLVTALQGLKKLGCMVIFDAYSEGLTGYDRLWRMAPHFVKLGRNLIENSQKSSRAKRMLNKLISLIHASGSLVVVEEIESDQEAMLAMRLNADFGQGLFWGALTPHAVRQASQENAPGFHLLMDKCENNLSHELRVHNLELSQCTSGLMEGAYALEDGTPMEAAVEGLLRLPKVERVYMLDEYGVQIGQNIYPDHALAIQSPLYKPLVDCSGATLSRRSCFRDAVRHMGVVQVSQPYRSSVSRNICTTLSIALRHNDDDEEMQSRFAGAKVLCCDVEWKEDFIL